MDYKTKVAQIRLIPSVVRGIEAKLKKTGLTMSDYLRLLVLKDLDRLPIKIPRDLPTMKLTKEQERELDRAMEDVKVGRVTEVHPDNLEEYFDNLYKNE